MTEKQIIQGCKARKPKCQEALVRTYAPSLKYICLRYLKDESTAQDALQDTFINVFKYIDSYKYLGSFEGWMKRIAVNCSLSYIKNRFQTESLEVVSNQHFKNIKLPDVISKIGSDELLSILQKLPQKQYVVMSLYAIEGYSHQEIGKMLGMNESSSRSALCRARMKLIQIIKDHSDADLSTRLLSNINSL